MDFDAVLKDRSDDPADQPATLYEGDGETALDIQVRTRGFYRLRYINCDVPPLRLNFEKGTVAETVFEGQDKLKLVTHCQNGSDRFQQYVFQEYLIYRAYRLLTNRSFLTRLVHITCVDIRDRHESVSGFGFIIEDEDRMAERIGGSIIGNDVTIHPGATGQDAMTLLAVFQYMVGNTDWTVSTHHNIKLVFEDSTRTIVAVPYDFDWSGLIHTTYATPSPKLGTRTVRERRFMGLCRDEEAFDAIFQRVHAVEEPILALFSDGAYLDESVARRSVKYLQEFFEITRSPRAVRREFLRACL
jgi:hypothetical protein